jgi:tetratricopeptide (TPR) repeat protein
MINSSKHFHVKVHIGFCILFMLLWGLPREAEANGVHRFPQNQVSCNSSDHNQLINWGIQYYEDGDFEASLNCLESATEIIEPMARSGSIDVRFAIGRILFYQGRNYTQLTNYPKALRSLRASLEIFNALYQISSDNEIRYWTGSVLQSIGVVLANIGDHGGAIEEFNKSLQTFRLLGNSTLSSQSSVLNDLGLAHRNINQYETALQNFQESLRILRLSPGERNLGAEFTTLGNIARTLASLNRYQEALNITLPVLEFRYQEGDLFRISVTLNDLGNIYAGLDQFDAALAHYQQSLAISKNSQYLSRQALTLQRIGELYAQRGDIVIAIVFLKRSVDVAEDFRQQLVSQGLSSSNQESYISSVEDSYRLLASLLLQQNRIIEAQQVLDLLKVQELDDYLRGVRGVGSRITILRPEREILERYDVLQQSAIEVGRELATLRKRLYETGSLPDADQQRLDQLLSLQEDLNNQFSAFLQSDDIKALVSQLSPRPVGK